MPASTAVLAILLAGSQPVSLAPQASTAPSPTETFVRVYSDTTRGITPPAVVRMEQLLYTPESLRAKVQGEEKFDLKSVSPLAQSARINAPVLIAHGEQDDTVSPRQGRKLVEALAARKANVSSVFYKDGGHDFSSSEDFADFLRRLETFLAKHNPA